MIVITRRELRIVFVLCGVILLVTLVRSLCTPAAETFSSQMVLSESVAVDPGHGGEDGGAVSGDGIKESHLNLEIALRLRDLFEFSGHHVHMTRTEDQALDHGEATIKARKRSDLKNRAAFVEDSGASALITIHQNSLPSSPITRGAQVFYNTQPGAADLSVQIQDHLNRVVNRDRPKKSRKSPEIYLMNHISVPGILVECGFLSNREETILLKSPEHQVKIAAAIVTGYLRGRS